jgi:hypothetical protein
MPFTNLNLVSLCFLELMTEKLSWVCFNLHNTVICFFEKIKKLRRKLSLRIPLGRRTKKVNLCIFFNLCHCLLNLLYYIVDFNTCSMKY